VIGDVIVRWAMSSRDRRCDRPIPDHPIADHPMGRVSAPG